MDFFSASDKFSVEGSAGFALYNFRGVHGNVTIDCVGEGGQ